MELQSRRGPDGLGMDSATRQRPFEPFFTTKDPLLSTGLGLATASGVIKQSQGYIWAESALGQGTSLQIYLPQAELAEQDALPSTPHRPAYVALTGRNVLVVEDEPLVRRAARRILEREGCQVLEASDGVAVALPSTIDRLAANLNCVRKQAHLSTW